MSAATTPDPRTVFPMNLTKSTCRSHRCTTRAFELVSDGFCSHLLCPQHARTAAADARRRGYTVTVTPAANVKPDPDLDRRKALQVAGIFNDESDIS